MRSAQYWMDRACVAISDMKIEYRRLLAGSHEAPPEILCMDITFQLDQQREILVHKCDPGIWVQSAGKFTISDSSAIGNAIVGLAAGDGKFLPPSGFLHVLASLCGGPPWNPVSETEAGAFLNLVVAEASESRDVELVMWWTVARAISAGGTGDLHRLMPALKADILSSKSPVCGAGVIRDQSPEAVSRRRWRERREEMIDALSGSLQEKSSPSEGRTTTADVEPEARAYVRDLVFRRVAERLDREV